MQIQKSYFETNDIARSPTLQTVLMVEKFIEEHSSEFKKTELFNNLPRKVMWQTFQVIMEYLEKSYRITIEKDGIVTYIWNPKLLEKVKNMSDVEF